MKDSQKREIINYATPPISVMIVGAVFTALSPVGYLIARAVADEKWKAGVVCGSMALAGIIFICVRFYYAAMAKHAVKDACENAIVELLSYDFKNGRRFLNGRVICGKHYIFSKGLGAIIRLGDIDEIRRETKCYRGVPTAENLSAKVKGGKKITICSINVIEGTPPLSEIISEMTKYAPDIKFKDKRL